jgi:phospholipase C
MKRTQSVPNRNPGLTGSIPFFVSILVLLITGLPYAGCKKSELPPLPKEANKIKHVVVIYLENHSFDNLYGQFPGADGLSNASSSNITQVDASGTPYTFLPSIPMSSAFPLNLPNNYFNIDQYIPNDQKTPDVLHRYYQEQLQIDGGKMDKFALLNNTAGLSQGYYQTSLLPLLGMAQKYTLCDNFFHSAFGGSFLNHIWLIAAASPVFPNAPAGSVAKLDSAGKLITDGAVTPDGYVVNTSFTVNNPHPATANPATLVPNQTIPTIGDRLNDKHISWAWYAGGCADSARKE